MKNFFINLVFVLLIMMLSSSCLQGQSVIKSNSWCITANLTSLIYGTADGEVEYIPLRKKTSWSVRIIKSYASYDGCRALGLCASYRRYLFEKAPSGMYAGIGIFFHSFENDYGLSEAVPIGPKLEAGYHFLLGRESALTINGNIKYNLSNDNVKSIPSGILANDIFPPEKISVAVTVGLSFLP